MPCSRLRGRQEVDQNVSIGNRHRQYCRIFEVSARRRSASFGEKLPQSRRAFRRITSELSSSVRYLSMASAIMRENPLSPRRAASSSKRARCSSLISTVVLIVQSYFIMHVHGYPKRSVAYLEQIWLVLFERAVGQSCKDQCPACIPSVLNLSITLGQSNARWVAEASFGTTLKRKGSRLLCQEQGDDCPWLEDLPPPRFVLI
jgi:hypothetical protein